MSRVPQAPLHGADLPVPAADVGVPSAVMLERAIQHGLQRGIDYLKANPALLERIFANLEVAEVAKIKAYFADKPPVVMQGYARAGAKLPLISVVLGTENTAQQYLDDYLEVDDESVEHLGALWQMRFDVLVYTEHPDVTLWYYTIAKYVCMAALRFFQLSGMQTPVFSGSDMEPQPDYLPDVVFVRTLSITCQGLFPYVEATGLGRYITGIYRDDATDVDARVHVVEDAGEDQSE